MSRAGLKRGIRVIFEIIRTGQPRSRQRHDVNWRSWLLAAIFGLLVALLRIFFG